VIEQEHSTAAIAAIANALNIPTVAGVPNAANLIEAGDDIVIDGSSGRVDVIPPGVSHGRKKRIPASSDFHRAKRVRKTRSSISRSSIRKIEVSRDKLREIVEALDGYAGGDVEPEKVGNRQQIPIPSDVLDTIRFAVVAAMAIQDAPIVTKAEVGILKQVREMLVEFNKTLDALNGTIGKSTKTVRSIVIFGVTIATPVTALALGLDSMFPVLRSAIEALGKAISASARALGV
jgi:hypothetical protein